MHRSLASFGVALTVAFVAMSSTSTARADATGSSLFLLRAAETQTDGVRTSWVQKAFTLKVDPTLRARWAYDSLASLPETESKVRTYDIKPIVATLTYQTLDVSSVHLTFITTRSVMVADLGKGAALSLDPKSIHSGTVTFSFAF